MKKYVLNDITSWDELVVRPKNAPVAMTLADENGKGPLGSSGLLLVFDTREEFQAAFPGVEPIEISNGHDASEGNPQG